MKSILVPILDGRWNGLRDYIYGWGGDDNMIREWTAEEMLEAIRVCEEKSSSYPNDYIYKQINNGDYEDGDEYECDGETYEVHEITIYDCQRLLDKLEEEAEEENEEED